MSGPTRLSAAGDPGRPCGKKRKPARRVRDRPSRKGTQHSSLGCGILSDHPFQGDPDDGACASCFLPRPRIFGPPHKGNGPRGDLGSAFAFEEAQSCLSKLCFVQLCGWSKVVAAVRNCSRRQTQLLVSLAQAFACVTPDHVSLVRDFCLDQAFDLFSAFWRASQGLGFKQGRWVYRV